jgi:hypothetical protein
VGGIYDGGTGIDGDRNAQRFGDLFLDRAMLSSRKITKTPKRPLLRRLHMRIVSAFHTEFWNGEFWT